MASFDQVTRSATMTRVTERLPYTGGGVDALIAQVSAILKMEKEAQRIILDVTKPYVHLEKYVRGVSNEEAKEELQTRYDEVTRNVPMKEFVPEKIGSKYEYVHQLFRQVTDEGFEVVLVLVGNISTLDAWISVSRKDPKLFGVQVKRLRSAPSDVIIVCGAEWKEAEVEDIRFTVKGVMG